ncbi:WXG100 family type VII secretion target [Micromonospora sp. NPDC000207]|uniref:WXG100 family type VII secretion target n=1 Tax=Micromonospora sp. NPDC000207 TaxID=3154246 RepID=UPI00331ABA14
MTNPLVAPATTTGPTPWAGLWIAEDIELIHTGIRNGNWIDGTLGVVSAGLDALALVTDPAGALLQYGIAWLIEHVKPLTQALDWLAGDPTQITAHAQTWRNTATHLRDTAADLTRDVRADLTDWTGHAATTYRTRTSHQHQTITTLAAAADTMATLTETTAGLVAAVRLLVRDAIATCISRLTVYATELVATAGLATPLVIQQVTTTVATWAARITKLLRALINSLRQLIPATRRLTDLINKLKETLNRRTSETGPSSAGSGGRSQRDKLLEELSQGGIRHNPDEIVAIGRDSTGKVVFLETGNERAGLAHITGRHGEDFMKAGVPEDKIAQLVLTAATQGEVVGRQRTRPIYEVLFEGKICRVAVTVGDNGFVVGANPVGQKR